MISTPRPTKAIGEVEIAVRGKVFYFQPRARGASKVVIVKFAGKYIEVGNLRTGRIFAIPRISFAAATPKTTIKMIRRQYPLHPAYGGTVHKIQGLTLSRSVFRIDQDPFTHGQLYVGSSRTRHSSDLWILTDDQKRAKKEFECET